MISGGGIIVVTAATKLTMTITVPSHSWGSLKLDRVNRPFRHESKAKVSARAQPKASPKGLVWNSKATTTQKSNGRHLREHKTTQQPMLSARMTE